MRSIYSRLFLLLGLLSGSRAGAAQDVLLPFDQQRSIAIFHELVPDSLAALERYRDAGRYPALERVATFLLTRYPGRVLFASPKGPDELPFAVPDYPQAAYAGRALARTNRGDFRGAEADLDQVLRYAPVAPAGPDARAYAYDSPPLVRLRDTYYARATLRFDYLNNRAGGCADLGAAYQLDTVRASHPKWRGCPLPATRRPVGRNFEPTLRAGSKDISRVLEYLDAGEPSLAAPLLAQLRQGRVGAYTGVPLLDVSLVPNSHPERGLAMLSARLDRQQGRYAHARATLDSLIANTLYTPHNNYLPVPLYRRERANLLLGDLRDPAGCADVRWLYEYTERGHDTTAWPASWHRCPLPRYRVPVSTEEVKAYQAGYEKVLAQADALIASKSAGQVQGAIALLTNLLRSPRIGPFEVPTGLPDPEAFVSDYAKAVLSQLPPRARLARSRAYEALADYPRAVADLDTLIATGAGYTAVYCRRGVLRADYLYDRAGACADLKLCYQQRGWPGAKLPSCLRRWRGCDIPERSFHAITERFIYNHTGTLRLGFIRQGTLRGGEIGYFLSSEEDAGALHGPSAGLEVAGGAGQFVLGPKIGYEGTTGLVGSRVDLIYYLNYLGDSNRTLPGDLRLIPQVGLALGGILNVYYGYAIPIAGRELRGLGYHRFTLSLNFLHIGFKIGG